MRVPREGPREPGRGEGDCVEEAGALGGHIKEDGAQEVFPVRWYPKGLGREGKREATQIHGQSHALVPTVQPALASN